MLHTNTEITIFQILHSLKIDSINEEVIKKIKQCSVKCLSGYGSVFRRLGDFIEGPHLDANIDSTANKIGGFCAVSSVYNRYTNHITVKPSDFTNDTWMYRLALRFSTNYEITQVEQDKVIECIKLLVSNLNFTAHWMGIWCLVHAFGHNRCYIYRPIRNFLSAYPMKHSANSARFSHGDFDEYRIEQLYPALYELFFEKEFFSRIYEYRETVPIGVQEFIDRALYLYTYNECGREPREDPIYWDINTAHLLANVILTNPNYIGVYENVLIVRKGTEVPVFEIGNRRVSAVFHKTHTNVGVAMFPIGHRLQGVIFKEWGYHRTLGVGDFNNKTIECVYGLDSNNEYQVATVSSFAHENHQNAGFKVRYIFSQLISTPKDFYQRTRYSSDPTSIAARELACSYEMVVIGNLVVGFPGYVRRLLRLINKGFALDDMVEISVAQHQTRFGGCDCNEQLERCMKILMS